MAGVAALTVTNSSATYGSSEAYVTDGDSSSCVHCVIPWDAIPGTNVRIRLIAKMETSGGTIMYRVRVGGVVVAISGTTVISISASGTQNVDTLSSWFTKPTGYEYIRFTAQSSGSVVGTIRSLTVEIITEEDYNMWLVGCGFGATINSYVEYFLRGWVCNFDKFATDNVRVAFCGRGTGDVNQTGITWRMRIGGSYGVCDGDTAVSFEHIEYGGAGTTGGETAIISRPSGVHLIKSTMFPDNGYTCTTSVYSMLVVETDESPGV